MFNGYYDLGQVDRFVPYVGAGVGVAFNRRTRSISRAIRRSSIASRRRQRGRWPGR
jgi:opacity protein-like surface antigen